MTNDFMRYKGYYTKVVYSEKDKALIGRIEDIQDKVMFDADNIEAFEKAFHESVDDYLDVCKQMGKEPQRAYSGSFNIRIAPDLHRGIAITAANKGESMNRIVEQAIASYLHDAASPLPKP